MSKMTMKEFVQKAEQRSKESINRAYRSIDMLHYELDFLNNLLHRYSNKKSGLTFTYKHRQNEMNDIRDRIPRVYEDINYYKECINVERKEMARIYNTYCGGKTYEDTYETLDKYEENNYEPTNEYEYTNEYDEEEITDYKYNFVTDTWE